MSELSEVVAGQVNERFLEVPTNSTYFADLATLNAAQVGAQNPFDAVVREVVDLRAAAGNMSAFDSRYMPLDKLWLPAGQFDILAGSPSTGTLGNATLSTNRQPVWLLDQSSVETVGTSVLQPANWATFDVYVWWSNAGAGAGDVVWQYNLATFANAETTDSNVPSGHSGTFTAPLQYVAQRDKLSTSARNASPGEILKVAISRVASVAGDTLANDCGLIGVELVRVS